MAAGIAVATTDGLPARSSSRLRVLQIGKYYAPFKGGIETHLRALSEGIADSVTLEVIVSNSSRITVRERVGQIVVKRLARHFSISTAPVCLGLKQSIRHFGPDIVHIHLPNPAAVVALLASGYSGPIVATYHSDVIRQRVLARLFEPALQRLLHRCSGIIATSTNYVSSSTTLRAFESKCRVIPYGIDQKSFGVSDPDRVRALRSHYDDKLVLAVGRLIYYKGFEFLIDAMRHVDGHLVVVGDGPLLESLIDRARQQGVSSRISFPGELGFKSLVNHYHAARVFVLPSIARSEAFGLVQLEAMGCGVPVINTALDSGVPFVSLHGKTGLTVPPRDVPALSSAIQQLLTDSSYAQSLGRAGRQRVAEKFSANRMCDQTLELYAEIASAHSVVARYSQ